MAEPKADSASFLLNLGRELGELRANMDALLGRIESLEGEPPQHPHVTSGGGGGGGGTGTVSMQLRDNQVQPEAKPQTPMDTFLSFGGEIRKLSEGLTELKKFSTEIRPMMEHFKGMLPAKPEAAPTTQPQQPAATAPTPIAASVFAPEPVPVGRA